MSIYSGHMIYDRMMGRGKDIEKLDKVIDADSYSVAYAAQSLTTERGAKHGCL